MFRLTAAAFPSTLILLSLPKLTHFLTYEVMLLLIHEHFRLSLLLKAENNIRPSRLTPRELLPILHSVPGLDAEVDGRHLRHFDGLYGNETFRAFGADDDTASPLNKLKSLDSLERRMLDVLLFLLDVGCLQENIVALLL